MSVSREHPFARTGRDINRGVANKYDFHNFQIKCLMKIKGNRDVFRKKINAITGVDINHYETAYIE